MNSNHNSQAFGLGFETRMAQKASNESGSIICSHVQQNQTIRRMYEVALEEVPILREESYSPMPMQHRDYL